MSLMRVKSETTVNEILTAAENFFVEKNYADVSMAEIAYMANVTKGALYHHFEGKEALYIAMLMRDFDEKRALFQRAVTAEGNCRARLELSVKLLFALPPHKRNLIRLVRRDINIFKGQAREKLLRAYQSALPEVIEAILRDGIEAGEIAAIDVRLLSWEWVAIVEVVLTVYAQDVLGSTERCVEQALNLFFGGVGVR